MDLIAYLRIFRRRWGLLALPALGALMIALVTLPEQQQAGPVVTTYTAKATIIAKPNYNAEEATPLNLSLVALFATVGDVPERAAKMLEYEGEPQVLASQVSVTPATDTSTLTVSGTDPDADAVAERVNAFAEATVRYFRDQQQTEVRGRLGALDRQLGRSTRQMTDLQEQLTSQPDDPILQARLDSLRSQYSFQFSQMSALRQQLGGGGPLEVLQAAVPIPQTTSSFVAPTNPLARLSIAGLLGLLLGAALALLVERLDSRLRTREQVEDAFGLPVLAEIPSAPRAEQGRRGVVSVEKPASASAEAFRALRSAVLLLPNGRNPDHGPGGRSLAVLVTSALPGEGKTTTVANLAAVLAEAGRRVIVLSFDLRNPRLHEHLDVADGTGISDLLAADRGEHLEQILRETRLAGVKIATSGQELGHPGALLAAAGPMIQAARRLADVVLIDTAPILTVSDAIDIAQHVDVALVVSRLNKTTNNHAAAAQRLLSRLGVPALGTVLVGSRPTGARDDYRLVNTGVRDHYIVAAQASETANRPAASTSGEGSQGGQA